MLGRIPAQREAGYPVYTVAVSQDGTRYLWGGGRISGNGTVTVCDVSTNDVLHVLTAHEKPVLRARFLSDASIVTFSFDSHICRWTPEGRLWVSNEEHQSRRADGFSVSADGRFALVGHYDGTLSRWCLTRGTSDLKLLTNRKRSQIWSVLLGGDGTRAVVGGADGLLQIWDLEAQVKIQEVDLGWGHHVQALAWHPDQQRFAAAISPDGAASEGSADRVLFFNAGTLEADLHVVLPESAPSCCEFSPDGRILAVGHADEVDGRCPITVKDASSGTTVAELAGHGGIVRDLALSLDSAWLLSAGWDGNVRRWRLG